MKEVLKKIISSIIQHSAILGLFGILPLTVILYLGHSIITKECDNHLTEVAKKLEFRLKDIESDVTPELFMLKVARGAWFSFNKCQNDKNTYWDYYKKLKIFLNKEIDLYVFNDNGSLITPNSFTLKSRFLANKLWNTIVSDYDDREIFVSKYIKQLKSFLGNEFKLGTFLESRNNILPIIINAKEGFIYWINDDNNPKKGILAIFWEKPSYDFRLKQIIKQYSYLFNNIFIKDSDGNNLSFTKNNNRLNNEAYDNIYLKTAILNINNYFLDSNGNLWKAIKFDKTWLLASFKSKKNLYDNYHSYFIAIIYIITFCIVFIYFYYVNQQIYYVSIRIKLIALFLIAVITPLSGFAYIGYQYVIDTRNNLISNFENESREVLLNIDREIGKNSNIFREDFRKLIKDFQNYDEDEKVRKRIKDSLSNLDLAVIERRNLSDAKVIKQITNTVIFDRISSSLEATAKCTIDNIYSTNLRDTLDPALKKATELIQKNSIIEDNIYYYTLGDLEYFAYWYFQKNKNNETEYNVILRIANKVLQKRLYQRVNECIKNPIEKKYTIIAYYDKQNEWIPNNSLSKYLKSFSKKLNFMGKIIKSKINIEGKDYLLLSIKSEKIKGYSFFALYPYINIENELFFIKRNLVISIILFIIIVFFIGYRLAGIFIYPVNCLEAGISAIKERNPEFRIEELQNDEFGELAKNFNNMISGLKEMELAKHIQESLLPQELPNIKGYQLSFTNRMASAIGGDYFDVQLLDEDNLCIIIGDVSGHGVASALVMAIAKAVIFHGFKQTRDLITLFNFLNSVINTYFSKPPVKKMITLFATIINLSTGKAVFFDAGHNFPMKISKDGNITELKMTGFPVGVQKKIRKKNTEEYLIEKGDTIVFYTDGIIEATGKTTEQYGYDRFKESLSKMANEKTDSILKTLFKNYEKWEDGTEPDDDVTLVVLRRISS